MPHINQCSQQYGPHTSNVGGRYAPGGSQHLHVLSLRLSLSLNAQQHKDMIKI